MLVTCFLNCWQETGEWIPACVPHGKGKEEKGPGAKGKGKEEKGQGEAQVSDTQAESQIGGFDDDIAGEFGGSGEDIEGKGKGNTENYGKAKGKVSNKGRASLMPY